ncbi:Transketolase, thiamine diphosphate binding domain-containing protein [Gorgonomyces haynaldii]|nr:Transketolase, thiamine diphosphate binding domain-containing protein [Gorgonomyces haynaldii]
MSQIESRSINTVRVLAADVVAKSNSGHPGAPMGCAPMAHVLFSKFVKVNPADPTWISRDRFVLSNGHACVLQYIMWHLLGFNISMADLQNFRQYKSKTPGHPEANHGVDGIEVSTGPLGQGISNAVGLALAEAQLAANFNRPGFNIIDNFTYVILGDGCLQEGVQAEAAALAGHLQLGKLIALYDDNHITIDGDTDVSFTEDVLKRFESYGWHTQIVGDGDHDLKSITAAIENAKLVVDKPSIIKIRTTIGYGSLLQGEEKVHGAPLSANDIAQLKPKLGFNADEKFVVPPEVTEYWKGINQKSLAYYNDWKKAFEAYSVAHPQLASELKRRLSKKLPDNLKSLLPTYTPSDPAVATRKLSENVLNKIADAIPELVGGSADLTGSNLTRWKTATDFQPPASGLGDYSGRYIRFGVREHGMAAVCNGINAYGAFIPFGATFFNFITYAWGSVRLSALSKHHVLYIMTHDSIGLGEDGPTHQPIETLALVRATPNLLDLRPADGNEVSASYLAALEATGTPSVLILSRQNLPHLEGSSIEKALKGAYTLSSSPKAKVILVGTGSEVSLAIETAKVLATKGVEANIVSMPSWKLFEQQTQAYKESVFVEGLPVVSLEAMTTNGWHKYAHYPIGIEGWGLSAPAKQAYQHVGLVPDVVAEKVLKVVKHYESVKPEWKARALL